MVAALALACAGGVAAQEELEARRDKKLAAEFLKKAPWFTDYEKALEESKKTGKPIFGYFTRSYSP